MDIVINEKKKAEEIIKTGEIYKNLWHTKALLIKYFHKARGLDEEGVKDELVKFLEKKITHNTDGREYNLIKDMDNIDRAISIYTKSHHELAEDECIVISKQELEKIKELNNEPQEKLAFVLLVICKIKNLKTNEFTEWINDKTKEFWKHTKNRRDFEYQERMIHKLYDTKLIDLPPLSAPNNTSIKLLYVDKNVKKEDIGMEISDFREVVLNYLKWRGEKVINCDVCHKLILEINNKIKYCKECAKKTESTNATKRKRKQRKKANVTK